MGIFRKIFIVLDAGIYGILEQIFQLIINLANFDLFDGNVLKEFSTRIYLILGLVMVFKLMISFIQILIEPDKMSDKEKGVGSLLRRVVISLILIVLVPSIFSTAKRLQNYIIPIIPKVVVGVEADVDSSNVDSNATYTAGNTLDEEGNVMMSTGRLLAYYSFLPFFYYDNDQCNDGSLYGTTSDASLATIHSVGEAVGPVNNKCESSTNPDGYRYNYRLLTSTIVGAYLVYVLVTVALQIAIRTIKFGLCQVLAPIPIASYIDPKTSKQSFDKWVQTSIKVYLDLFTRLIVVYFVIFIFRLLFDQTDQLVVGEVTSRLSLIMGKYGAFQGLLLILFIIIGLLQFAKQMPKFVSDLLGVPDGFSDFGDMFKGTGWRSLANVSTPVRAGIDAAKMSHRAGETGGLSTTRGLIGVAGATGSMLKNLVSGKSGRESSAAALSGVHSRTRTSISRTNTFANEDGTIDVGSLRRGYASQRAAEKAVSRGGFTQKEILDSRISNFEKTANIVGDGRKSMAGHKIAKAYQQRYEAIKNTSEEAYQEQIRSELRREITQLEEEYTNPNSNLSDARKREIENRLNSINSNLNNNAFIRNEARDRKFRDTNAASRAVDDVQKRLFAVATHGADSVDTFLNDEDRRIAGIVGLNSNDAIYDDGQIMSMANTNAQSAVNSINDAMRKDSNLRSDFANLQIRDSSGNLVDVLDSNGNLNILDFDVNAAGAIKDQTSRLATDTKNSPEYFQQSSITPRNQDKKK